MKNQCLPDEKLIRVEGRRLMLMKRMKKWRKNFRCDDSNDDAVRTLILSLRRCSLDRRR